MPEPIRVVHVSRDEYSIYVGRAVPRRGFRASKWGNPFIVGSDGNLATVLTSYRAWLLTQPNLLAALPELRGKVLGCWCAPKGGVTAADPHVCHGQVLAELAEKE